MKKKAAQPPSGPAARKCSPKALPPAVDAGKPFPIVGIGASAGGLGLPDGSGLELMPELQRQRPVPGIALSGYGVEDDQRRTKEAGFFADLVKPVNLNQLRQLIDPITPSQP